MSESTQVAVKTVLTVSLSNDELSALQNEAKLAVGIEHPNVVRVLYVDDGEVAQGRPPYLVMEYVDGGTLRAVLDSHKAAGTKIGIDELRAMYLQIAEGMKVVNDRIVHRDLKPENVLVDTTGNHLKIADFGLAKLADAATRAVTFKGWGTRPYQAPESFESGPNTPAMDIYGAGVIFYELATLTLPVQPQAGDQSPMAWRNAHLLAVPRDIRTLRPDMPIDLVQLIMLMLQKNPAKRPGAWTEPGSCT
jgi:serine/threonine protein kinase